jgi:hypothetical protein
MEAIDVQIHLRRCGVVVHHAAPMPPAADGRQSVVVFLEGALGQFELARRCALRLPGVIDVWFSGHSRAIMYVVGAEPGGRSARSRRPRSPASDTQRLKDAANQGRARARAREVARRGTPPDQRATTKLKSGNSARATSVTWAVNPSGDPVGSSTATVARFAPGPAARR